MISLINIFFESKNKILGHQKNKKIGFANIKLITKRKPVKLKTGDMTKFQVNPPKRSINNTNEQIIGV
jgi:hypothetical protein